MAECKEESGGGGVAGESIYDWFEGSDQVVESIYGVRGEAGRLGPCEVEAVGESEDESFDDS